MKIIIFAGGIGTRFWPLSRKKFPKQFIRMFDQKSTLQLAIDRVIEPFGAENIYVSTLTNYVDMTKEELPKLLPQNIVTEPELRNLAPAVGYNLIRLKAQGYKGPVAILWADHLMKNVPNFIETLKKGERFVTKHPDKFLYLGEKARYAENNLGWIHLGEEIGDGVYHLEGFMYKPEMEKCKEIFESGEWVWNPGYFVMDLDFILEKYKELAPEMYVQMEEIGRAVGTSQEQETVLRVYPKMEKNSYDKKILEKLVSDECVVIKTDMEWSDPGTLYALKEAVVGGGEENFTEGLTIVHNSKDNLVINKEEGKLVVTSGLKGMVVVNTKDVILVVPKEDVVTTTDILAQLSQNPDFEKYL